MDCRGIRGAITVDANTSEAIASATRELLQELMAANGLRAANIVSAIFTATPDLDAAYPAHAAREMGWVHVPLLCMQEMKVTGSLARCIRVLVHWNTDKSSDQIRHVYLGRARELRPDLAEGQGK